MRNYHLTLAVRGRSVIVREEHERRALVRAVTRRAGGSLFAGALADDHLHLGLRSARPGYLSRDLTRIVRGRLALKAELKQSHLEPVDSRSYLNWLVTYFLHQPQKHGLNEPPALWTGSFFQDLVGARLLPGFDPAVLRAELPRLRLRDLFPEVGLEPEPLVPASDEELRRVGAASVVDLAAGVFAVGPDLTREHRSPLVQQARVLAAHVAALASIPLPELAHYMKVRPRTVRGLAQRPCEERAVRALRLRLALETRARSHAVRPEAGLGRR